MLLTGILQGIPFTTGIRQGIGKPLPSILGRRGRYVLEKPNVFLNLTSL
jgi:hypothetical protein